MSASTSLIDRLKMAHGAVATKDIVPGLQLFAIQQGRVRGFDGRLSIQVPAPEFADLPPCTVPATRLVDALSVCDPEADLDLEIVLDEQGAPAALGVASGNFSARMPCVTLADFPILETDIATKGRKLSRVITLDILKELRPFIGEDASRPWCRGVLFQGTIAAATNNTVIAVHATDHLVVKDFVLPAWTVDELLRIGIEPLGAHIIENQITFALPGQIYMRSQFTENWPIKPMEFLKGLTVDVKYKMIDAKLHTAVESIKPLCVDQTCPEIRFNDSQIATADGAVSGRMDGFAGLGVGKYRAEPLLQMLAVASHADWGKFPRVPWKGERLEGALVGLLG